MRYYNKKKNIVVLNEPGHQTLGIVDTKKQSESLWIHNCFFISY